MKIARDDIGSPYATRIPRYSWYLRIPFSIAIYQLHFPLLVTQAPRQFIIERQFKPEYSTAKRYRMSNTTSAPESNAAKFRALLADKENVVVSPGVYDGFTARLALAAGFETLYMVSQSS